MGQSQSSQSQLKQSSYILAEFFIYLTAWIGSLELLRTGVEATVNKVGYRLVIYGLLAAVGMVLILWVVPYLRAEHARLGAVHGTF